MIQVSSSVTRVQFSQLYKAILQTYTDILRSQNILLSIKGMLCSVNYASDFCFTPLIVVLPNQDHQHLQKYKNTHTINKCPLLLRGKIIEKILGKNDKKLEHPRN